MCQVSYLDKVVLDKINKKIITVDSNNGIVYGSRKDINGNKISIGHFIKDKIKFSLIHENKNHSYHVSRAIFLSVNLKIPEGMEVYNIDGDIKNSSINNLGIKKPYRQNAGIRFWTDEEINFLRDNYEVMSNENIAEKLNRSIKAIRHKIQYIKLPSKSYKKRRWTNKEDEKLKALYKDNSKTMEDISNIMNRSMPSLYLRINRYFKYRGKCKKLKDLDYNNFYNSFKKANQRGTLKSKCCLCEYNKYIDLHHIDEDRKNNHVSNIATLCPNHHTEVTYGGHKDKQLYAIWQRIDRDGSEGDLKNSLDVVHVQNKRGKLVKPL